MFLPAVAATLLLGGAASAAVVDGSVTSGSGVFTKIAAPVEVGNNNHNSPDLLAFDEMQGVLVTSAMALEIGGLTAGTRVDSHFVFFDALTKSTQTGWVSFSGTIVGVATSDASLNATDAMFGAAGTIYNTPTYRGLESKTDKAAIDAVDGSILTLDWASLSPGDYVRVFTLASIPVPAAGSLMLLGLGAAGIAFRRKKS
ncbi:PEP-CTERM sorting domain-containing protein [Pseudooceanicola sp. LIPI14-2-Ac024]|uniref:PEP-CTERM sorting domain-containing protein n=1 Tax=Pseudooceanicola sp. LIPI14-2-Ac024 TaxID=3344875 RepID=UPI0035D0D32C